MNALFAILFLLVTAASQVPATANPTCLQQYTACLRNDASSRAPSNACLQSLSSCAVDSCTCMDINTAAVHSCTAKTSSEIHTCTSQFAQFYQQCVETCTAFSSNSTFDVAEVHLAQTQLVTLFGLPSKCTVCKAIVNFAESRGASFACAALNLADLVPGCDFLGPVCGLVLNAICSKIITQIASHTPLNAGNICHGAGFCSSATLTAAGPAHALGLGDEDGAITSTSTDPNAGHGDDDASTTQSVATVVALSKKGVSQFLQRHEIHASQTSVAQCYLTPHAHGKTEYTCMEQLNANQANLLPSPPSSSPSTTTPSPSSSSSSSSSDLGAGIGIGVAVTLAVVGVFVAVVRFRRHKREDLSLPTSDTSDYYVRHS